MNDVLYTDVMVLRRRITKMIFVEIDGLFKCARRAQGVCTETLHSGTLSFLFFSDSIVGTVLYEIELFHGGAIRKVCVRVGYIGNLLMTATTQTAPQHAVLGY